MQFDYSRLSGRIVELYGTRTEFARKLGKSVVIVSKKLRNKSSFSQQAIEEWSRLLNIDASEYGEYFFTEKV